MANYYTKSEIKGNRYVITRVKEEVEHDIEIQEVSGEAVLTNIGAYSRVIFIHAGLIWISEPGNHLAFNQDKSQCIVMDNLSFDKDIKANWNRYISLPSDDKGYWIDVI